MSLRACLYALLLLLAPAAAGATSCGISASTSGALGDYNPFGTGISQATMTLTLTRVTSGNSVTRRLNFILVLPAGAPAGLDVRYQGASVAYSSPTARALSTTNPPAGSVYYDFGTSSSPNTVPLSFQVTVPPGLAQVGSQSIALDLVYVCTGSGSLTNVTQRVTFADAFAIRYNALSALQASYVGAPLDFGEIGAVTAADAPSHVVSGGIRIASSGLYTLRLSSENGYRMTYPGGDVSQSAQSVRYSVTFAGQTRSTASPSFSTVNCLTAGISGETVPISARLVDGGVGRNPSPDYRDTLTVMVTPVIVLIWPIPGNCEAY